MENENKWLSPISGEYPDQTIRFALEAMREVEQTEGFVIDMDVYHYSNHKNKYLVEGMPICGTCCAGAAALKRWVPKDKWKDIDDVNGISREVLDLHDDFPLMLHRLDRDQRKIISKIERYEKSLNAARSGNVGEFFAWLDLEIIHGNKFDRTVTCYHDDREAFYKEMEKLADDIQQAREAGE